MQIIKLSFVHYFHFLSTHIICRFRLTVHRRHRKKKENGINKNNQREDWSKITLHRSYINVYSFEYDYFPDNILHSLVATIFRDFTFIILSYFLSKRVKLRKFRDRYINVRSWFNFIIFLALHICLCITNKNKLNFQIIVLKNQEKG